MKKSFLLIIIALTLYASQAFSKELTIATNSWIGYTPLFYAKQKGYLDKLHIKLITSETLAQAAAIYREKKADMVTTTQHEYYALKQTEKTIIPVILFDRSNGADMVLSNKDIHQLQKAKSIDAYLKRDSINKEVLDQFVHFYHLDPNKITLINKKPSQLEQLKAHKKRAMLVVTFVPYNNALQKNGFQVIASTKETKVIVVVDSLCANKKILKDEKEKIKKLKAIIDRSITEMQIDTKASYALVKSFLNMSYDEYLHALSKIKWINKPSKAFLSRIKALGYDEKELIQ